MKKIKKEVIRFSAAVSSKVRNVRHKLSENTGEGYIDTAIFS